MSTIPERQIPRSISRLRLSTYRPDFTKVAVQRRSAAVLEWLLPYYRRDERQISKATLVKHLGGSSNPMFKWLKSHLLCETRSYHASAGRANSYVVNRPGYDSLFGKIHGRAFNYDVERARQLEPEFRPYLDGTMPIPLTQKIDGGRLYGEHQWKLERDVRRILLKGCWDYDIAVAMPCLMIQTTGGLDKYPAWSKYIGNRNYYRQKLATDYNVSVADAKEVFQLLFSLATFNGWSEGVGKVLGPLKTKRALKDPFLQKLYAEAKAVWEEARVQLRSKRALSGSERFACYEREEQKVMAVIYAELEGRRFWPFHDGFTLIDGERTSTSGLQKAVREKTRYIIMLSEELL